MIVFYRFIAMLTFPLFFLFGILFSSKSRKYFFSRPKDLPTSTDIKPIWIHASSGEFEHAKFLIKRLKKNYPHQKIVVSYSSPSYFKAIQNFKSNGNFIDGYFPMPVDMKGPIYSTIKRVNPKMVLFTRTDLWPELMYQLKSKKIPTLVFSRMEKSKPGLGERLLSSLTYQKADHISFISEEDQKSFLSKFKNQNDLIEKFSKKISVDGDPRLEEVVERASSVKETKLSQKTLILGSIWKEDLKRISPAITEALKNKKLGKLIVAPHDPTKEHLRSIKKTFKDFDQSLLSEDSSFKATITIVDSTGVLFDLYSKAHMAFVGGSFKKRVHSVIEPLAHGLPVLVGPYIGNNTEAKLYSKSQYGFVKICPNQDSFKGELHDLLGLAEASLEATTVSIQDELKTSLGASDKLIRLIESKIELQA